jgi:hypothetical protein
MKGVVTIMHHFIIVVLLCKTFALFVKGHPQLGQVEALSETSCPHSEHLISAISDK